MISRLAIMVTVTLLVVGGSSSQSLAQPCSAAPQGYDSLAIKGKLLVKENKPGREKLQIMFKGLAAVIPDPSDFGDPVTGTTSYAVCIYDDAETLVAQMEVDRAQQNCGTPLKPCWKAISHRGYMYRDKDTTADGIKQIILKSNRSAGSSIPNLMSSKILVKGENNTAKGQASLPTGIGAALQENTKAMVQVVTSDGYCFQLGITRVKKANGLLFKGVWP